MKKFKKLILTGGIFSSSLFFNSAYSQNNKEEAINQTIKEIEIDYGIKKVGDSYYYKDGRKADVFITPIYSSNGNKWGTNYSVKPSEDKTGNYNTKYGTYNTKKEYSDKNGVNRVTQYSNQTKTYAPNKNVYIPPATKTNSDLEKTLLIGGAVIGGALILNELFKPRNRTPVYYNSAPPANNPPTNYNSNPEENKKAFDEWLNGKEETENKNWWSDENTAKNKENGNWWGEDEKKSDNLLEKKIKETETNKLWNEEVKKADEFFKEKGINPGEPYKYKIVGTIEISPKGEIIKKESQLSEREITDEEKVILYYTDYVARNYTPAGPALKGIDLADKLKKEGEWDKKYEESKKIIGQPEKGAPENSFYYGTTKFQKDMKTGLYVAGENLAPKIVNGIENSIDTEKKIREGSVKDWLNQQIKEEKEVDFLFAKPIGDNTYYYFKLAGKEELYKNYNESSKIASYIAIKNSPYGDQIINIAKDFKEKVEQMKKNNSGNWFDE